VSVICTPPRAAETTLWPPTALTPGQHSGLFLRQIKLSMYTDRLD
jgi:hypothetical protein